MNVPLIYGFVTWHFGWCIQCIPSPDAIFCHGGAMTILFLLVVDFNISIFMVLSSLSSTLLHLLQQSTCIPLCWHHVGVERGPFIDDWNFHCQDNNIFLIDNGAYNISSSRQTTIHLFNIWSTSL
jgi:hypothetical protein